MYPIRKTEAKASCPSSEKRFRTAWTLFGRQYPPPICIPNCALLPRGVALCPAFELVQGLALQFDKKTGTTMDFRHQVRLNPPRISRELENRKSVVSPTSQLSGFVGYVSPWTILGYDHTIASSPPRLYVRPPCTISSTRFFTPSSFLYTFPPLSCFRFFFLLRCDLWLVQLGSFCLFPHHLDFPTFYL